MSGYPLPHGRHSHPSMVSRDGVHSGARTASEEAPNRHREGPKTAKELERHREGPKTTMELERHREGPKTTRELETVRKTFYEYQMKKDGELKQLQEENEALKADGARKDQELTKWISHSKSQSQKVQQLKQESHARVTDVEDVNAQLQQTIHKLEAEVENLEREKSHLANEVATANSIADVYKEDFERERSDRAKAAGKLDSLERETMNKAHGLAERFQKEMSESEEIIRDLKEELREAKLEIQTKAAQVKHYKQQVERIQQDTRESEKVRQQQQKTLQLEEMGDTHVEKSSRRFGSHFKNQKPKGDVVQSKTEEKAMMKAKKRERERSVKEAKENRGKTMKGMNEHKLKSYLEAEVNQLETENLALRHKLECSEGTTKILVEKLMETEAMVSPVVSPNDQSAQGSRAKAFGSAPPSAHAGSHQHHEDIHRQRYGKSATEHHRLPPPADSSGLYSKDMDYVNCNVLPLPAKSKVQLPAKSQALQSPVQSPVQSPAQSPVGGSRMLKPPIAAPRAASMDAGRGGPLIPLLHAAHQQPTSMPPDIGDLREEDISTRIDEDIRRKAAEVMEAGRDERRYTLTTIPFDPFLECLYCNQQFRYGEIQKYRKHVISCSGGSTS